MLLRIIINMRYTELFDAKPRKKNCAYFRNKVQLFWEGHKNLRNLPHDFDLYNSKRQNHEEDFCGLLRKAEL